MKIRRCPAYKTAISKKYLILDRATHYRFGDQSNAHFVTFATSGLSVPKGSINLK
nr:hypothetical protein [Pseudopedobacter sp.]